MQRARRKTQAGQQQVLVVMQVASSPERPQIYGGDAENGDVAAGKVQMRISAGRRAGTENEERTQGLDRVVGFASALSARVMSIFDNGPSLEIRRSTPLAASHLR